MSETTTEDRVITRGLPKLYRPVKIKFWSLRNELGENMGVMFDCDAQVERIAMRVRTRNGWKWQIKNLAALSGWDHYADQDQEILNEHNDVIEWQPGAAWKSA